MGFIEQAERLRQQQAREEQIKLESQRLQEEAALARQRTREEDRSHFPEDNKAICELIDNLSAFDTEAYMVTVNEQTGYGGHAFLFTRDLRPSDDSQLAGKLLKLGLRINRMLRTDPSTMFYDSGVYDNNGNMVNVIKPQIGSLFSRKRLTQPQEPGIGLHFAKEIEVRYLGVIRRKYLGENDKYYDDPTPYNKSEIITNHVVIRFVLPSHAIITGDGERINVMDLKTFDDALERGFKYPHQTRWISLSPEFTGGNSG